MARKPRKKTFKGYLPLESPIGQNSIFLPHTGPSRTVPMGKATWMQGVAPKGIKHPLLQCFSIDHARVIFGLLRNRPLETESFEDQLDIFKYDKPEIPLESFSDLAARCNLNHGGQEQIKIENVLGDLASTWSRCTYPDGHTEDFKILDYTIVEENGKRMLKGVHFSAGFLDMLRFAGADQMEIFTLMYDVWCRLKNDFTRYIYLNFTGRVVRETSTPFTEKSPWRKNISAILSEAGVAVPASKSERKRIFDRAHVVEDLSGIPIQQKWIQLHAELDINASGDDYNLCLWCTRNEDQKKKDEEKKKERKKETVHQWWIDSGRSDFEYYEKLDANLDLSGYVVENLLGIGYSLEQNRAFLVKVNKLLNDGEQDQIVGETKELVQTGKLRKTPEAYVYDSSHWAIVNRCLKQRDLFQNDQNDPSDF